MKIKIDSNLLTKIWVTSDTHAYHKNICQDSTHWDLNNSEFKLRPFKDEFEMTEQMVENFNHLIQPNDILIHLGDWSFGGQDKIEMFRKQLNVKNIYLVTGNHDEHISKGKWNHLFTSVSSELKFEVSGFKFHCYHHPILSWDGIRKGVFHLHGHQHLQGDLRFGNGRMMDVGVDGNDLEPYRLIDVIELLKDRRFVAENDHHV